MPKYFNVKKMVPVEVNIAKLKGAPYQPPGRTEGQKLKSLKGTIEEQRLYMPVLITSTFDIIDGHRRVKALSELGEDMAPCIVVKDYQPHQVFEAVNMTGRKVSSQEWQHVYLTSAIREFKVFRFFDGYVKQIGIELFKRLHNKGKTVGSFIESAKQIERFFVADKDSRREIAKHSRADLVERLFLTEGQKIVPSILNNELLRVRGTSKYPGRLEQASAYLRFDVSIEELREELELTHEYSES